MPFGEVMYRCNAHYCFGVFRNRAVGLVISLALMQLFLFSFYLNGLHGQTEIQQQQQQLQLQLQQHLIHTVPSVPEEEAAAVVPPVTRHAEPAASATDASASNGLNAIGAQLSGLLLDPSKSRAVGDVAKKALDQLMNNRSALDLVALAAKKLSSTADHRHQMAINLANAFNSNQRSGYPISLRIYV